MPFYGQIISVCRTVVTNNAMSASLTTDAVHKVRRNISAIAAVFPISANVAIAAAVTIASCGSRNRHHEHQPRMLDAL